MAIDGESPVGRDATGNEEAVVEAVLEESGPQAAAIVEMASSAGGAKGDLPLLSQLELQYKSEAYTFLQLIIGIIALALPLGVWLIDWLIDRQPLRGSISSYYYGRPGGFFVGSLCAVAVFLLAYDYRPRPGFEADNKLSNVAAAAAAGVALCPTTSNGVAASGGEAFVSTLHIVSAGVLFSCLATFSLFHFTKTSADDNVPWERARLKRFLQVIPRAWEAAPNESEEALSDPLRDPRRNAKRRIHQIAGWLIVACMAIIVVINIVGTGTSIFWPEAVAVMVFGVSWLVKSEWVPGLTSPRVKKLRALMAEDRKARRNEATGRGVAERPEAI